MLAQRTTVVGGGHGRRVGATVGLHLVEQRGEVLHRDGEADTVVAARHGGDRGVDADDPGVGVGERAARVAGVDRGVGLDQAGQCADRGLQLTVQAGDDAGGHRRLVAVGAAEGDRHLTDFDAAGFGDRRRHQVLGPVDGHDGEVTIGQPADHPAGELAVVGGAHGHLVAAGDHVVGGEDQAGGVVDDARADAAADLDLHDGGAEGGGDGLRACPARWTDRTGVVAPADSLRSRTTNATAPATATASTAASTAATTLRRVRPRGGGGGGGIPTLPSPATAGIGSVGSSLPSGGGNGMPGGGGGTRSATGGEAGRSRQVRCGTCSRGVVGRRAASS